MRPVILVFSAALILDGCSTSLAPTLPSHTAAASHSAPIVAADRTATVARPPVVASVARPGVTAPAATSSEIDLGALAGIVARLPHDLYRFEIDLFICAGAIVAIGIVNAFLIASLLATRRGTRAPDIVPVPVAAVAADATAATTPEPQDGARACACGEAIGARSKTGRCRRCATASRAKRPPREVATARA